MAAVDMKQNYVTVTLCVPGIFRWNLHRRKRPLFPNSFRDQLEDIRHAVNCTHEKHVCR